MDAHAERPMPVHCAANDRGTAFVKLYRESRQGLPPEIAFGVTKTVGQPDPVGGSGRPRPVLDLQS